MSNSTNLIDAIKRLERLAKDIHDKVNAANLNQSQDNNSDAPSTTEKTTNLASSIDSLTEGKRKATIVTAVISYPLLKAFELMSSNSETMRNFSSFIDSVSIGLTDSAAMKELTKNKKMAGWTGLVSYLSAESIDLLIEDPKKKKIASNAHKNASDSLANAVALTQLGRTRKQATLAGIGIFALSEAIDLSIGDKKDDSGIYALLKYGKESITDASNALIAINNAKVALTTGLLLSGAKIGVDMLVDDPETKEGILNVLTNASNALGDAAIASMFFPNPWVAATVFSNSFLSSQFPEQYRVVTDSIEQVYTPKPGQLRFKMHEDGTLSMILPDGRTHPTRIPASSIRPNQYTQIEKLPLEKYADTWYIEYGQRAFQARNTNEPASLIKESERINNTFNIYVDANSPEAGIAKGKQTAQSLIELNGGTP